MFFAANHYTNIKIMILVEKAMASAITLQTGVINGTIKRNDVYNILDNIAFNVTQEIIKEKSVLRCEPSKN